MQRSKGSWRMCLPFLAWQPPLVHQTALLPLRRFLKIASRMHLLKSNLLHTIQILTCTSLLPFNLWLSLLLFRMSGTLDSSLCFRRCRQRQITFRCVLAIQAAFRASSSYPRPSPKLCTRQRVLPCINLNHPNIAEFKQALPDCKAWFFLGKGGAMVPS